MKVQIEVACSAINHSGRWLSIVGIGEDGLAGLSPVAAASVIATMPSCWWGASGILALVPPDAGARCCMAWPNPLTDAIEEPIKAATRGKRVVVLASGDPFLWRSRCHAVTLHVPVRMRSLAIRVALRPSRSLLREAAWLGAAGYCADLAARPAPSRRSCRISSPTPASWR